jgi:hypothetical protein
MLVEPMFVGEGLLAGSGALSLSAHTPMLHVAEVSPHQSGLSTHRKERKEADV